MLFAHLKRILGLERLRLRGPCGARDEFHLAAIAQNFRKLAKLAPPPAPGGASPRASTASTRRRKLTFSRIGRIRPSNIFPADYREGGFLPFAETHLDDKVAAMTAAPNGLIRTLDEDIPISYAPQTGMCG